MQFVKDELEAAIPHLADQPQYKSRIGKAAAKILKARVHLFNKEWVSRFTGSRSNGNGISIISSYQSNYGRFY